MLSYCLKCRKNKKSKNHRVTNNSNGRVFFLSECAVCNSKKQKFTKKQRARALLSQLGIRTPLNKIPLLGDILF